MIRRSNAKSKRHKFTLYPDFVSTSITDVDFNYLKKKGIKACFVDLDGTVVSRGTYKVKPAIGQALKQCGLAVHIATNRPKGRSLQTLKEDLHATSVIHPKGILGKPTKQYYQNALKSLHLKPHEVVMIGDRYIQDIFGANRAGIYTLLVYKLGESKGKADAYISKLERKFTESISSKYQNTK